VVRVSSRGRIVLPAKFRRMDSIQQGEGFDVVRFGRGDYRLVRREASPIDWLFACPHKGYFVRVESESTDDL
jgi:bifunctional DNA-binding transcriptional regulator/antitoxin component of YhaV-PrlF toxin-antitoxin module